MFNINNKRLGRNLRDVSDVFFSSKEKEEQTIPQDKPTLFKRVKRYARVIPVTSGKGGTGKSIVTSNLAIELVRAGKKIAILDADLGLANLHLLMGGKPRYTLINLLDDNKQVKEITIKSPGGVRLVPGASGITELANLTIDQRKVLTTKLSDLERKNDIILIDTGAGININTLMFLTVSKEMIVVTTPDITALTDAYAVIKATVQQNKNIIVGLIVNRVKRFEDAHIIYNKLYSIALKFLNIRIHNYGYIFDDEAITKSIFNKTPVALLKHKTKAGECIKLIGQKIVLSMDKKLEDIVHRRYSYFNGLGSLLDTIK